MAAHKRGGAGNIGLYSFLWIFMKKVIKTKVVELDEPVNFKPVAPSDLFSNSGS